MKRRIIALALLALAAALPVLADPGANVIQSSCSIMEADNSFIVYCYAQVYNGTSNVVCMEKGSFELRSGDDMLVSGSVEQMTPYFLKPGESGYLYDAAVLDRAEGEGVPSITGLSYNINYYTVDDAFANRDLVVTGEQQREPDGSLAVLLRVQNPLEEEAWSPTLAGGLYTEGGALLYCDGRTLENVGIPAGGEMTVRFDISKLFAERWAEYGADPAQVKATADCGGDD